MNFVEQRQKKKRFAHALETHSHSQKFVFWICMSMSIEYDVWVDMNARFYTVINWWRSTNNTQFVVGKINKSASVLLLSIALSSLGIFFLRKTNCFLSFICMKFCFFFFILLVSRYAVSRASECWSGADNTFLWTQKYYFSLTISFSSFITYILYCLYSWIAIHCTNSNYIQCVNMPMSLLPHTRYHSRLITNYFAFSIHKCYIYFECEYLRMDGIR